jgi:serine/threonine-protein kinase RsbW
MSKPDRPEVVAVRMPSRLELLSLLDRVTDSVCERLEFDENARSQVSMSVIEAGTNAIQHGHRRDATKPVDIEYRMHPDMLEIVVRDTGRGFDPNAINGDVTSPEHLLDSRGRGIFIMKSCMDRVEFDFTSTGTQCRLFKNRPSRADDA